MFMVARRGPTPIGKVAFRRCLRRGGLTGLPPLLGGRAVLRLLRKSGVGLVFGCCLAFCRRLGLACRCGGGVCLPRSSGRRRGADEVIPVRGARFGGFGGLRVVTGVAGAAVVAGVLPVCVFGVLGRTPPPRRRISSAGLLKVLLTVCTHIGLFGLAWKVCRTGLPRCKILFRKGYFWLRRQFRRYYGGGGKVCRSSGRLLVCRLVRKFLLFGRPFFMGTAPCMVRTSGPTRKTTKGRSGTTR